MPETEQERTQRIIDLVKGEYLGEGSTVYTKRIPSPNSTSAKVMLLAVDKKNPGKIVNLTMYAARICGNRLTTNQDFLYIRGGDGQDVVDLLGIRLGLKLKHDRL
jgi:hypothetical protein